MITRPPFYELLPAIHRIRDDAEGKPLAALAEILGRELDVVEADIDRLYANGFIETCDEWVLPYLGDLLGVRNLHGVSAATFSQRAFIANTLAYRRRKGTATMLEQLARDTTGWDARAVEFFERLGWTQNLNHLRPQSLRTPDLRRTAELELLDTAFDTAAHAVDVRHIASGRGRHNLLSVGLFLWRLQSYTLRRVAARAAAGLTPGRFHFHPVGLEVPLFNEPVPESEITHLAEEINVPGPLRRRPLYDELEVRRAALVNNRPVRSLYFTTGAPVFQVFLNGSATPVSSDEVLICDLSDWHLPPDQKAYPQVQPDGTTVPINRPIQVAVDPHLGRLTVPTSANVDRVLVDAAHGFSGDVGGGPYPRLDSVMSALATTTGPRPIDWQAGVSRQNPAVAEGVFPTFAAAITAWKAQPAGTVGLITVMDNDTYADDLVGADRIEIPEGSLLILMAADWPKTPAPVGPPARQPGHFTAEGLRPHLLGNLEVIGTAPANSPTPGECVINGLLIEGQVRVLGGHLGRLGLDHSTVVPANGGLDAASPNPELKIRILRSVSGAVRLAPGLPELSITESIIDGLVGNAVSAPESSVQIQSATLLGRLECRQLSASDSLLVGRVTVERRQEGCVRFCYVPPLSTTPRRYRCQPDLALAGVTDPSEQARILARLVPQFSSKHFGQPDYTQLSGRGPVELAMGAEDGAEMGVWKFLQQPQREANLRGSLDEYLRFGLEAGLVYVT
ncbi:MAG: hypothetical protein IT581_02410 [Verrucomicrobiales bacterium]|nr:hypothetical protein [Verrucomicrobiales bacterium]